MDLARFKTLRTHTNTHTKAVEVLTAKVGYVCERCHVHHNRTLNTIIIITISISMVSIFIYIHTCSHTHTHTHAYTQEAQAVVRFLQFNVPEVQEL
ncbi:hypothetical protein EON65_35000, partial [archaeon]